MSELTEVLMKLEDAIDAALADAHDGGLSNHEQARALRRIAQETEDAA